MSDDSQQARAVKADINSSIGNGAAATDDCSRPLRGPLAAYIPNVVVQTHNFRRALFYDDLLRGKLVLIHCVSVQDRNTWSSIETLVDVQALLGDRLGKDIFIYSLATDAEHDTPQALRGLAEKYGAGDGWLFLTAEPATLELLHDRLFGPAGGHHNSMNLIRYGNVAAGLWGGILATANAESIAERLSWVDTGKRQSGELPQRKGPAPLS
jgi:protein SCO1